MRLAAPELSASGGSSPGITRSPTRDPLPDGFRKSVLISIALVSPRFVGFRIFSTWPFQPRRTLPWAYPEKGLIVHGLGLILSYSTYVIHRSRNIFFPDCVAFQRSSLFRLMFDHACKLVCWPGSTPFSGPDALTLSGVTGSSGLGYNDDLRLIMVSASVECDRIGVHVPPRPRNEPLQF